MKYLAQIVTKFAPQTGFPVPVAENIEELCETILAQPNIIYIEEENKGAILGIVYPHWWNPSVLVAQELGWWVEPEYRKTSVGIRLLKQFELEVTRRGASVNMMICLEEVDPDYVEQLYTRLGYHKLERIFAKEL